MHQCYMATAQWYLLGLLALVLGLLTVQPLDVSSPSVDLLLRMHRQEDVEVASPLFRLNMVINLTESMFSQEKYSLSTSLRSTSAIDFSSLGRLVICLDVFEHMSCR